MNQRKLAQLKQYIESADLALQQAREILTELGGDKISDKLAKSKARSLTHITDEESNTKIIEGVFNGQNMLGPDSKEYSVPANYASKSKLVEGDILKLTIQDDGSFIYKQIKPVERERLKGEVVMDEVTGRYSVLIPDGRKFDVLTASVTYFKGGIGDQAVILVPKNKTARCAAIENIVKSVNHENDKETDTAKHELLNLGEKEVQDKTEELSLLEESKTTRDAQSSYQGITQHVNQEPILPNNIEQQTNEVEYRDNKKSEQERQKIEQMINENNLEIDDLDQEDLEDL